MSFTVEILDWPVSETRVFQQSARYGALVPFVFVTSDGQQWQTDIAEMAFDLIGDGAPPYHLPTPDGGRPVRSFGFTPGSLGEFDFVMTARDRNGCEGQSVPRHVVVTP